MPRKTSPNLELAELLDGLAGSGKYTEDVETDSLAKRPALADGNLITLLNTEGGRDVRRQVLVSLLVTGVLGDVVKVFAADDDGSVHLGGDDGAGQDTATDGDETSERALLVCRERIIVSFLSFFLSFVFFSFVISASAISSLSSKMRLNIMRPKKSSSRAIRIDRT